MEINSINPHVPVFLGDRMGDKTLQSFRPMPRDANASIQKDDVEQAGKMMESMFLFIMLKEMRKTIPESDLFGGTQTERNVYGTLFDEHLADSIAESGGIGLAKAFESYLTPPGIKTPAEYADKYNKNSERDESLTDSKPIG